MQTPEMEFKSAQEFRNWLRSNHDTSQVLWLVFRRKGKRDTALSYAEALEEALCYGWIDSIIKKIDGEKYLRKFTPRTNTSNWSKKHIGIVKALIADGRMTKHGRSKISDEILNQKERKGAAPALDKALEAMFQANREAWHSFTGLAPSYQKQYIGWIQSAKRKETRMRRAKEALALLEKGKKLEGK